MPPAGLLPSSPSVPLRRPPRVRPAVQEVLSPAQRQIQRPEQVQVHARVHDVVPAKRLRADTALGWAPLLEPGLALVSGNRSVLRAFHHEIAHFALHQEDGHVLWCDAAHGFDPYWLAELNLVNGHEADAGARRLLVKRCMTPFQWDSVLTQHLDDKLLTVDASLVIAAPYDALFSTDELTDWEQEDYVRYSLRHLRTLTRRHRIPLLVSIDMDRWWRTHPTLAKMAYEVVHSRWSVTNPDGRLVALRQEDGQMVDPYVHRQVTLLDFLDEGLVSQEV